MEMFQGEKAGVTTKTCRPCRDDNKKQDENRDREHRNALARIAEAKPERKQVKKESRNPEKMVHYDLTAKANSLAKLGPEGYLAKNAEGARKRRANNPEKQAEFNRARNNDVNASFKTYIRSAEDKNHPFELSKDQFLEIVYKPCYYCGVLGEETRDFNGIDRMDQTEGYNIDNCVSSCKMCNYMKLSLDVETFLKRVEHVVTYNRLVIRGGRMFPAVFANHNSIHISFRGYQRRAMKKGLDFTITKDDFAQITSQPCYVCGKMGDSNHKTGIDRFDSSLGYVLENCRPCCGECNVAKKKYDHAAFMDKLVNIFHYRCLTNSFVTTIPKTSEAPRIIQKSNKMSKEEIAERSIIRTENRHKRLLETIGNEEFRKRHAEEIIENKKKQKTEIV